MRNGINFLLTAVLFITMGCSGSSNVPTMPVNEITDNGKSVSGHAQKYLWGFWDVAIDPVARTVEIIPIRGPQLTVNVVTFMQPPIGGNSLLIAVTDVDEWFTEGKIGVDVTLLHPFPGLDHFTGFDVYGVLVHEDGLTFPYGSDAVTATDGLDNAILENADGYTAWMSPALFPDDDTILTFTPGKLGTPGFPGNEAAEINGYKYFADGLASDESVAGFFMDEGNFEMRGKFSPGSSNSREYLLDFPMLDDMPLLLFQYAVVANWEEPDLTLSRDPEVLDVPGDFPVSANAGESFFVNVTDNSTTWYVDGSSYGGNIILDLEVFDWDGLAGVGDIYVSSAGSLVPGGYQLFEPSSLEWSAGGWNSSVATVEITGAVPTGTENQEVMIVVESAAPTSYDQGLGSVFPDLPLANYFRHTVYVSDTPTGDVEAAGEATIEPYFDGFGPEGTVDDPIPTEWWLTLDASGSIGAISEYLWEMNGDDLFDDASGMIVSAGFPDTGTHVIRLKVTDGAGGEDIFDLAGSYEVVHGTYVWEASPIDFNNGTREAPWYFIPDGVADAGTDGYILVRGDDDAGGQCMYTDDLTLNTTSAGTRIQGYYGDYDTDVPPHQTGFVKIMGDNVTFDGFEVSGSSMADYQPYGWDSKLGVLGTEGAFFRHIYMHDIGTNSMGDGFVSWAGGSLTIQNCLTLELGIGAMINNRSHNANAFTEMMNCTFDRLGTVTVWGWYNSGTGTSEATNCIWTDIGGGSQTRYLSRDGDGIWTLSYNCCMDTATPPDGGGYYVMSFDPYTFDSGEGSIEEDPEYVDPYSDHHLQSGSPCEDTGNPDITDADGTRSDFGCYGGPYCDWDFEN